MTNEEIAKTANDIWFIVRNNEKALSDGDQEMIQKHISTPGISLLINFLQNINSISDSLEVIALNTRPK